MDLQTLSRSNNAFGFDLLRNIRQEKGEGENVVISPTSIHLALAMLLNGAAGDTRKGIARALHVSEDQLDAFNQANQQLMASLQNSDPAVQLDIANALFAKLGFPFNEKFLELNTSHYQAAIDELDFENDPDGSIQHINNWCSEKTREKIPTILNELSPEAIMVLANAIYFKAPWTMMFIEEATHDQDFHLADGSTKTVPMMVQSGKYAYVETDRLQAATLDYAEGQFSMIFALPKGEDVGSMLADMSSHTWDNLMAGRERTKGTLVVPRFKSEGEYSLNDVLQHLGMEDAFSKSKANFSAMIPPGMQAVVSSVKHKTFIELTEKGTEAAAVTAVEVCITSVSYPPPKEFNLVLDRPFVLAIRENSSGALLFVGAIANP